MNKALRCASAPILFVERMFRILRCAAAALLVHSAAAQYPSRPIHLLVPFPPGGGPDLVGRILAPKLSETLGHPVVVENRAGGNGNVAGEAVAKSPADGHTLLLGNDSLFVDAVVAACEKNLQVWELYLDGIGAAGDRLISIE